jgi:hypothetical protein
MKRVLLASALLFVPLAIGGVASADDPRAAAQAAFDEGRQREDAGDYLKAIELFTASERLDPALGTTMNLAVSYEGAGRIASAMRTFQRGAEEAAALGEDKRARRALELAAELRQRVSTIQLDVREPAEGETVYVDMAPAGAETWSQPIPMDGGRHVVAATAAGRQPWNAEITIAADGAHANVEIPPLEALPSAGAGSAPVRLAPTASGEPPAPPSPSPSTWRPDRRMALRIAGGTAFGVGLVAIGAGLANGLKTRALWGDRQAECSRDLCTDEGYALTSQARSSATRADVAFAVGGAMALAGVVLFVVGERRDTARPALRAMVTGGALVVAGSF